MVFRWVEEELAGNDTTWLATQVGPRRVESGLGGHDDGASGVNEGVERPLIQLSKRGRLALPDCPTFGEFCGQVDYFGCEEIMTETFLPKKRCRLDSDCFNFTSRSSRTRLSLDSVVCVFSRYVNQAP